jgi:hypothetical protein
LGVEATREAADERVTQLEEFLAERGRALLRVAAEILFNASSCQFTGYVRNGRTTPVVRHPKSAPLPPAGRAARGLTNGGIVEDPAQRSGRAGLPYSERTVVRA